MKGGVAQRARRRSAMAHRWSMRLASSRRSRRSSAGCRGRSSSSGTGGDAAARGGRGRVMGVSFSLLNSRRRHSFSHKRRRNADGRRAFRRAVGGLGGAPGRRPECDVCYRFDADRRSARTGFHELGAGAGLIGYPRRPRRAGACLRQASWNGPRNPRDPGRNLSDGRVERPVARPRRLLVLMLWSIALARYLRPRGEGSGVRPGSVRCICEPRARARRDLSAGLCP